MSRHSRLKRGLVSVLRGVAAGLAARRGSVSGVSHSSGGFHNEAELPPEKRHAKAPGAVIPASYDEQKRLGWWD